MLQWTYLGECLIVLGLSVGKSVITLKNLTFHSSFQLLFTKKTVYSVKKLSFIIYSKQADKNFHKDIGHKNVSFKLICKTFRQALTVCESLFLSE